MLLVSIIDAAPKPTLNRKQAKSTAVHPGVTQSKVPKRATPTTKVLKKSADKNKRQIPYFLGGNVDYPDFYDQPSSPLIDFQSALRAAFLSGVHYAELEKYLKKQNLTDSSGNPLPLEAKTLGAFETAFGDKIGGDAKNATDLQGKFLAFENIGNANVINPFLLANNIDDKFLKADNGVSSVQAGKLGNVNSSVVALVNPYHSSHVNAVFGPEIAPHYEIHYSPAQGLTLDSLPPFAGAGINSAAIGVPSVGPAAIGPAGYGQAAFEPAAYGPEFGPFSGFGIAPNFNSPLSPYPYPYPFLPGFDPKGFKPNGKGNGGKKPDSTEQ